MSGPRIAIIGAGSVKFTAQILSSLLSRKGLRGAKLFLMDIDAHRLGLVTRYAQAIARGSEIDIIGTADRDEALAGADFVIVTVAIGGLTLKRMDVEICAAHGVTQVKGDTTGPAGTARALRSVPFFVALARDMERLCPGALMINLSNPMGAIVGAVAQRTRVAVAGICTTVESMAGDFARKLGVPAERLTLYSAGLNHFTWMTDLLLDGKPRLNLLDEVIVPAFGDLPVTTALYRQYGMFPIPGYKYASEFFPFDAQTGFAPFDAGAEGAHTERDIRAMEEELQTGTPIPPPPPNTDSEAVVRLIVAVHANLPGVHVLNVSNEGQLPFLPEGAAVEGPVFVQGRAIRPLCPGTFTEGVREVLSRATREQMLVIDASLSGDRRTALEAVRLSPLSPADEAAARALLCDLLTRQRAYLPAFYRDGGNT